MSRQRVTLQDVANLAGVSITTVSRVMNDSPHVRDKVRKRVRLAVTKLGYQPNPMARGLRGGRDATIGVVVDSLADIFFATLVHTIEQATVPRGLTITVGTSGRDPQREQGVVERLLHRQVSGLIVAPSVSHPTYLSWLSGTVPTVFVDRPVASTEVDAVIGDDRGGALRAVRHLLDHGHRRIAVVSDSTMLYTSRSRLEGYREAMRAHDVPVDERLVVTECEESPDAAAATEALLDADKPATAIFSSNARCTIGVVSVLHRRERNDVAVVGFGDFPLADALRPGVTVVDQDPASIGAVCAERLLGRIDGTAETPTTSVVPVRLIERGTGEVPP